MDGSIREQAVHRSSRLDAGDSSLDLATQAMNAYVDADNEDIEGMGMMQVGKVRGLEGQSRIGGMLVWGVVVGSRGASENTAEMMSADETESTAETESADKMESTDDIL